MSMKDFDASQFNEYRSRWNFNAGCEPFADDVLQFWREGKGKYLYKLMGEQFILSRKLSYTRPKSELYQQMDRMSRDYRYFVESFCERCDEVFPGHSNWRSEAHAMWCRFRSWVNTDSLISGRVPENCRFTYADKVYTFSAGQKLMKALRQFVEVTEMDLNEFERFRVAHSQVLNQKKLTGELCLSIHPLDYATASDNENGWSSCMSWQEEGCYRLGTVEMMNSPCVICAYLKSDSAEMNIGGKPWPSKKWRAWIVVTPDAILCERNYPYDNAVIAKTAIEWVRELATANCGWDFHTDITTIRDLEDDGWDVSYKTNFMYNDTADDMYICIADNGDKRINVIYSGAANCMQCGEEIEFCGDQDSNTLLCNRCRGGWTCACCGEWFAEGSQEGHEAPDGNWCCDDCFSERVSVCEECDTEIWAEDAVEFGINLDEVQAKALVNANDELSTFYRWGPHTHMSKILCEDCLSYYGLSRDAVVSEVQLPAAYDTSWSRHGETVWMYNLLNPNKVTWEQAFKMFYSSHYSKPELNAAMHDYFKTLWTKYTNDFNEYNPSLS